MAPGKAHLELDLDENKEVIPVLSLSGHLAAGVPGTVAGMGAAHEKYGKLSWEELISPSVRLARNGFALTASQVRQLYAYQDAFRSEEDPSELQSLMRISYDDFCLNTQNHHRATTTMYYNEYKSIV